jgi:folate-binding protein YgfZ
MTESLADAYHSFHDGVACVPLTGRGVVRIHGVDAEPFLQSLVSQDLAPLRDGNGAHSLLLQPQGKLVADFRILRSSVAEWWCDGERDAMRALAEGLSRFRIRVDATIEDRSDDFGALTVRGPGCAAALRDEFGIDVPERVHDHAEVAGVRVVRADWPGVPGVDVLGPVPAVDEMTERLLRAGMSLAGEDALEVARIEAGVPRQGLDLDDRTIAQEAFLDRDAVSFTKGCFVGQELVCRIDTRGHVNRHLRRVRTDAAVPSPGAELRDGDRVVGAVTSIAAHPGGGAVGLAMVRREVEPPAALTAAVDGRDVPVDVEAIRPDGT